jgi:RNA recognition motif-containing protein
MHQRYYSLFNNLIKWVHIIKPILYIVLTRTLFVGPIPDHYEKEDVAHIFSKYGELASVIVSKKLKGRHNAFLKYTTGASTEAAKYDSINLVVEDVPVKVNWAFGFGPKKHFNYDRGDSIIPLAELSTEEKDNLMSAPVGGFQGQPVREFMTVEEPEAQYRPEWKNNDEPVQQRGGGFKRQQGPSGANFEEINSHRKRGRFGNNNDNNNNGYGMMASLPQQQQQPMYNDQQGSPLRGQGFYQQQQQQQQQHYDPSISVNHYADHQQ